MKNYQLLLFALSAFSILFSMEESRSVRPSLCKLVSLFDAGKEVEISCDLYENCRTLKNMCTDLEDVDSEALPVSLYAQSIQQLIDFHFVIENEKEDSELHEAVLMSIPLHKLILLFKTSNFLDYTKQNIVLNHLANRIKEPKSLQKFLNHKLNLDELGGQMPLVVNHLQRDLKPFLLQGFFLRKFKDAKIISLEEDQVSAIGISSSKQIVIGSDKKLIMLDAESETKLCEIDVGYDEISNRFNSLCISSNGKYIVTASIYPCVNIWQWDGEYLNLMRELHCGVGGIIGETQAINNVALTSDGGKLLIVGVGLAECYDIGSGALVYQFIPKDKCWYSEDNYSLVLTEEDHHVIIGSSDIYSTEGYIRMWGMDVDCKLIWEWVCSARINKIKVVGESVIVLTNAGAYVLDKKTGKTFCTIDSSNGCECMINEDGTQLGIIDYDGLIRLYDMAKEIAFSDDKESAMIHQCIEKDIGYRHIFNAPISAITVKDEACYIGLKNGDLFIVDLDCDISKFNSLNIETALLCYCMMIDPDAVIDLISSSKYVQEVYEVLDDFLKEILFPQHMPHDLAGKFDVNVLNVANQRKIQLLKADGL